MTGATVQHQEIFIEPKVLVMTDLSESAWCHDWCQKPGAETGADIRHPGMVGMVLKKG